MLQHCSRPFLPGRHAARPGPPGLAARPVPRGLTAGLRCRASWPSVNVEDAKRMLERDGWAVLDVRTARQYNDSHITKPARCSHNVPLDAQFLPQVTSKFPSRAAKLIVACADGGSVSDEALSQLASADYTETVKMEGGYAGWTQVWAPSGKRRPPPGRWVSTGKEALKSGLNIPGVAESYDEGGNLINPRYAKGFDDGGSPL